MNVIRISDYNEARIIINALKHIADGVDKCTTDLQTVSDQISKYEEPSIGEMQNAIAGMKNDLQKVAKYLRETNSSAIKKLDAIKKAQDEARMKAANLSSGS